ncbi:3-oxoacyl-ACP synthase [Streptosporangium nondiastaticum]|uniref:3-oxoacyl-ACP synthase n=1 Tax=Streptosporangium nondiastaticum TaxID=35764 RepID=A0A9X7JS88_9ACTN|nr:beta-ketoacyl-[acyl-carrier-protein] synthase family protein [Streptosporangium nondiastaticum]PSJ28857.1 3-oxoacyl-ACP synthase [Streptosporangium nondiastaticum]
MSEGDVAVTGLGLVTAAGVGVTATWEGLLAGRSRAAPDPRLAGLPVDFSCGSDFDAAGALGRRLAARLDRFSAMALAAAREAVADAGLDTAAWDPLRVAVVIGASSACMEHYDREFAWMAAGRPDRVSPMAIMRSIPNMAAGEVGLDLGTRGPNLAVSTACASGATAIGVARDLVRAGSCDIALAGGSESLRARSTAVGFHQMRALSARGHDPEGASRPFDADRDGFVLGEGAGVLVLERPAHARARGARPRALLRGYGASCDAHHTVAPHPDGRGAADALRTALADAGLAPGDVDHVNAHGTATRINDLAEYRALARVFRTPPPVTAPKSVLGHAAGGSGGIEAACAVLTLQHQLIPPTANLDNPDPGLPLDIVRKTPRRARLTTVVSNSFGFGGQNAVLVFGTA